MAKSSQPAEPDAPADPMPDSIPAPERAAEPVPDGVVAEYISEQERTYHFPGAPLTARRGDIALLPHLPADGHWREAPGLVITRLPDNHPDKQPSSPDPGQIAHSLAERERILTELGLLEPQEGGDQS